MSELIPVEWAETERGWEAQRGVWTLIVEPHEGGPAWSFELLALAPDLGPPDLVVSAVAGVPLDTADEARQMAEAALPRVQRWLAPEFQ